MDRSHLRRDPITQRWIVISPERADIPKATLPPRPTGLPPEACPFCPGKEAMTDREIYVEREAGSPANGPGWWVRVVPDVHPILHIEGGLGKRAEGMYDSMNAIGAHEVLIETPDHDQHWSTLEPLQLERALRAAQQRMLDLRHDVRFRHVIWAKNHGQVTSLFQHPHSHIVASPFVPRAIEEELKGFGDYARWKERCVLCDVVKQEIADGRRVLLQEGSFLAFVPFASPFPFETWVVPVKHWHDYGEITPDALRDLACALRGVLRCFRATLDDPPFGFVLHSSPLGELARDDFHWHIELVPRPLAVLGLEWGTGIYINPVEPEEAAARLRSKS